MGARVRIAFFGHVRYSRVLFDTLLGAPEAEVVAVLTRASAANADACTLAPRARELGIPCLMVDQLPQHAWADWLRRHDPDVGYVFGWSTMLRRAVLDVPRRGLIGYHPTPLPRNRGHHPIIWALALGLEETASTFFFLNESVDAGDIVSQERVPIGPDDDAGTLYERLTSLAAIQVRRLTLEVARGAVRGVPQNHADATWWRRRGYEDGQIDWRMSAAGIHRLVRALARPYDGAHCRWRERDVKIWKARPADPIGARRDVEPGRVLACADSHFVVKCGEGALEILDHGFDAPPAPGTCLSAVTPA